MIAEMYVSLIITRGIYNDLLSAPCRTGYTRESISLNVKLIVSGLRKVFKVYVKLCTLMTTF
jgi:hypothetical protein